MNPDVPTPVPSPTPPDAQLSWLERQEHAIAAGLHSAAQALDPVRQQIENSLAQVAHDTWQNAAAFGAAYFERNKAELGSEAAKVIMAAIVAAVPGASVQSVLIEQAIVTEAGKMFAVLVAELKKEGQVIAPPPSPAPAPAPAPPSPSPAPAPPTPAPEPVKP